MIIVDGDLIGDMGAIMDLDVREDMDVIMDAIVAGDTDDNEQKNLFF